MDGLAFLFNMAMEHEIVQIARLSSNSEGEGIFKITYPGGYFMGTEEEIRNRITPLIVFSSLRINSCRK